MCLTIPMEALAPRAPSRPMRTITSTRTGTGPYMFTNVSEMAYVKLTQNPLYWGNNLSAAQIAQNPILDPGHVKNVIINDKPDDFSRYSDLSTGNAQIGVVQGTNWNLIQSNPAKFGYLTLPPWNGAVFALAMNTQKYPTNNTDFRQAIAHAINYSAIYSTAFHGKMNPMVGPETPGWKQFYNLNNYSGYQYNVSLAQSYLAKSGIDVSKLAPLDFTQPSGCSYCNIADQLIQSNLAAIGIQVNIDIQSYNLYQAAYSTANVTQRAQAVASLIASWGRELCPFRSTHSQRSVGYFCKCLWRRRLGAVQQCERDQRDQFVLHFQQRELHPGAAQAGAGAGIQRRAVRVDRHPGAVGGRWVSRVGQDGRVRFLPRPVVERGGYGAADQHGDVCQRAVIVAALTKQGSFQS